MNFFDGLFKKRPVIEADDPVFGQLTYEDCVWISLPKPSSPGYMVTIAAPETGPTELQRNCFQRICSRLAEFEQHARAFMRSRVHVDVSQLSICSIEIGTDHECQNDHFVLEMCDEEADVIHRVTFENAAPIEYGADD